ncbi:MAG: hypothetical protein COY40_06340 [Alphaproteobacteria bacterium CG_4_10_14_0_8_um_filter_53_9]|nr:MAG: hypothetical protein COY40_06340 [Alphaproteobacteria bacterium CG_4_10_14_0_8_um_filter_53_9]
MNKIFALLLIFLTPPLHAGDLESVLKERDAILHLRYNEELSTATTAADKAAVGAKYKDKWGQPTAAGNFGDAKEQIGKAVMGGDSSYAQVRKASETTSETMAPTLNYYEVDENLPSSEW